MLQWNKFAFLSRNPLCRECAHFWSSLDSDFTQILLRYLSQKMTGKASDEETQKLFDIEGGDPGFVAWPSQLSLHCSAQPDKPNTVYLFRKLLRKTNTQMTASQDWCFEILWISFWAFLGGRNVIKNPEFRTKRGETAASFHVDHSVNFRPAAAAKPPTCRLETAKLSSSGSFSISNQGQIETRIY